MGLLVKKDKRSKACDDACELLVTMGISLFNIGDVRGGENED